MFKKLTAQADAMCVAIGSFEQDGTVFRRKPPFNNVIVTVRGEQLHFSARGSCKSGLQEFRSEALVSTDLFRMRKAIKVMAIREP